MKIFQHNKKTDEWTTVLVSDAIQFMSYVDENPNPNLEFFLGRNLLDAKQKTRPERERQAAEIQHILRKDKMRTYVVSDWNINSNDVSGVWDYLYTDEEKAISDLKDALKKMYDPDDDLTDKEFFETEKRGGRGYFVVVEGLEAGGSVTEIKALR